jgi:hypothetical protein
MWSFETSARIFSIGKLPFNVLLAEVELGGAL